MDFISFDSMIVRRGTNCSKWDAIPYDVKADDMIPMWVADMDFACPLAIIESMRQRLEHPIFGYMQFPDDYWGSIIDWHDSRYQAKIQRQDIVPISSVLGGVAMAVQGLTHMGDAILVPTPGYHAFCNAVHNNKRKLIESPMHRVGNVYEIDFELMENQIKKENVKLVLFCSPHNPTGRLWDREELSQLIQICHRNNVYLVSDEIHADMTLTHSFTTIFSADALADDIAIALYAPTKTFNLAGLCTAYAVVKNKALSEQFQQTLLASGLKVKNTLGIDALICAYRNCGDWVDELQEYLLSNAEYAVDFIGENLLGVQAYVPQATYFLWIDFSETGFSMEEIIEKCVCEAHVAIIRGTEFIQGGEFLVRMNYACPRSLLKEALVRLQKVFGKSVNKV